MGKLDGKVAVITGGSTGMALAGAKLFVDEGAHVFISGGRQEALDEAGRLRLTQRGVCWTGILTLRETATASRQPEAAGQRR